MLYLLANLLGLLGLVGLFYLTGWLVDRVLMEGQGCAPYAIIGRFCLGSAVWMGWVFVLAAVQALTPSSLGLSALLALVLTWRVRRTSAEGLLGLRSARRKTKPEPVVWVLGALTSVALVSLWLQAQWPQIGWDANVYHLTVPRLYLEHGGFRRIPFNVYSNWPLNTQMLYALALTARDHVLAKSLHFAFGTAVLVLVLRVVKAKGLAWAGWLAGILFLFNPVVLAEFRHAYVDLAFALFLLLAFVMMQEGLDGREHRERRLVLAGVFAGVAAGIKPTGLLGVLCLLPVLLVVSSRSGRRWPDIGKDAARILVPTGLLLAPWMIKSWILTGNPAYPFLYGLFGGPEWSSELSDQLGQWQRSMGMGRSWLDFLMLPFRVILAGGRGYDHFDGRISPLWLVIIPFSTVAGRRNPWVARSLGFAGLYFISWALTSQQMRFLIPILPFLAIAAGLAAYESTRGLRSAFASLSRVAVIVTSIAMVALGGQDLWQPTRMMLPRILESGDALLEQEIPPIFRYIDSDLPENARLLFLNTNHGFFCERWFIADSFFEASQINSLLQAQEGKAGVQSALESQEITHILVLNRNRSIPWPPSLYEYLNDPSYSRRIHRSPDRDYDVFEIVAPPASGVRRSGADTLSRESRELWPTSQLFLPVGSNLNPSTMRYVRKSWLLTGLCLLGAETQAMAQPACPPLPPPAGPVIEAHPSDAGQLKNLINSAAAGTTILLHDGFYDMSNAGSSQLTFWDAGVTLRSYSGNRSAVILDGDYVTGELISIRASNVTIADLTLRRAYYHPIHISGQQNSPISGVVIHNVRVVDPGEQAIKINPVGNGWVDYGVIECSSIELTSAGRSQVRNSCYTGGIDAHAARGWTVRRNRIEGFWCASGLSEHGVHFWRASRDTLVEQNVIVDCARGVGFGLSSDGGTRSYPDDPYPGVSNKGHIDGVIRNNFIAATDASLFSSQYGFDTGVGLEQAAGARVLHNSVASSQSPASSSIEWRFTSTFAEVANNLTTGRLLPRNGGQATLQGNISSALSSWFEDLGSGDLHLTPAGDPAVDNGSVLPAGWANQDFDHQARDTDPDVGADELVDPVFADGFEGGLDPWIVSF